jgi:hypothetical protein
MKIVLAADERALPNEGDIVLAAYQAILLEKPNAELLAALDLLEPMIRRATVTRPRTVSVKGSKPGITYRLNRIGVQDNWMCDCPGYCHRGRCKHSSARKAA